MQVAVFDRICLKHLLALNYDDDGDVGEIANPILAHRHSKSCRRTVAVGWKENTVKSPPRERCGRVSTKQRHHTTVPRFPSDRGYSPSDPFEDDANVKLKRRRGAYFAFAFLVLQSSHSSTLSPVVLFSRHSLSSQMSRRHGYLSSLIHC